MTDTKDRKEWVGKHDVLFIHYEFSCPKCEIQYASLSAMELGEGPLCPFCGKTRLDMRRVSE